MDSNGNGIYPSEEVKFFDAAFNETDIFKLSESTIIYNIPDYVAQGNLSFTYFIQFEPLGDLRQFTLTQEFYQSICHPNIFGSVEMSFENQIITLFPDEEIQVLINP